MAKIGCKYLVYAPITVETANSRPTYGTGGVLAKLTKADVQINTNNVKMYGDDYAIEVSDDFTDGTITVGVDYLSPTVRSAILGERSVTVQTATEYQISAGITIPYVGMGYVESLQVNNTKKFRAWWYLKCKCRTPNETSETKGQQVAFGEETLVAEVVIVDGYGTGTTSDPFTGTGTYAEYKEFESFSDAQTWLKGKANIT